MLAVINHCKVALASTLIALAAVLPAESGPVAESLVGFETQANADFDYAQPMFSGSWQKDFQRSDNWEQNLNLQISKMRAEAERRSRSSSDQRLGPGVISLNQGGSGTNIIDLARFAESISRSSELVITQNDKQVRIKREGKPDLVCESGDVPHRTSYNEFGSEVCSLNEHQLLFIISLPGRIDIYHRFEISPDGQSIHQLTNVSYSKSLSFELVQYFNYFEAPDDGRYTCTQTLSRGKVCRQRRQAPDG
ncbi:MAG: hypothetical protein GYB33_12295 [Gammaproteobacteria bacterium]|nr:hypothetical protein [Gammaproteobacteria bacterium]